MAPGVGGRACRSGVGEKTETSLGGESRAVATSGRQGGDHQKRAQPGKEGKDGAHWRLARPDPGHPGRPETLQGALSKLSPNCTLKSLGSFSKALSLGLTLDQLD